MMLVTVDVLKNALTPDQKEQLIEKITAALVEVEGSIRIHPMTFRKPLAIRTEQPARWNRYRSPVNQTMPYCRANQSSPGASSDQRP